MFQHRGQSRCTVPHLLYHNGCWRDESFQAGFSRNGLLSASTAPLGFGPGRCWHHTVCSSAPAILYEECHQSIISLTPEEKEIFLLWTGSLTGCNEITTICNSWKSLGGCPGGGSLEGMAVPWQGDDLHNPVGILPLQYVLSLLVRNEVEEDAAVDGLGCYLIFIMHLFRWKIRPLNLLVNSLLHCGFCKNEAVQTLKDASSPFVQVAVKWCCYVYI